MNLPQIHLPEHYNYIGAFLSLSCNLSCSYCINHLVGLDQKRKVLSANEWIEGLNRISSKTDLPISLQGGEPSIHPGFLKIINNISKDTRIDLLTNIQFDPFEFMKFIDSSRFDRSLPYPAIRVSYHPETMDLDETLHKVKILHDSGYSIGIFTVDHPDSTEATKRARDLCDKHGITFKTKELLGLYNDKLYGTYHYPDSVFQKEFKTVQCKTSELLISPEGNIYRCHHDLYNKIQPVGHILDPEFKIEDIYRQCDFYGNCNPCDVKLKNNRFQNFGHCSVDIKF
ncbi:radical SAM protein [Bacteriovorax sp. Seq25_V]|uniref:radical SAM protein n=1 Tax=Bacteriovorax sp. Seq25_V TaxID=1201288 RepID=UPI00038A0088|nr:radical SAM protein [Bacteriovorax sp. Seq25_V]EQC47541.1 4Fe-4S single cluster domain protein [Bacteriovorax sp. Seq25_V]